MPIGPGKYDDLLTTARKAVNAKGGILILLEGEQGAGFACQMDPKLAFIVPKILRDIADEMDRVNEAPPKN